MDHLDFDGIRVDPCDPDAAWRLLAPHLRVERVASPAGAADASMLRVVCISDTHDLHRSMPALPEGDLLVHTGDFTRKGTVDAIRDFADWFSAQRHAHKVVIAGNHDLTLDAPWYARSWPRFHRGHKEADHIARDIMRSMPGVHYLEDSGVELLGLHIWGSPVQPEFFDWAFNKYRGRPLLRHWAKIPDHTDILLTHGPPLGYGDRTLRNDRVGCANLLHRVRQVRPRLHVFGHIHEDPGITTDGHTRFVNASTCTVHYEATQPPVVVDLPRP